MSWLYSRALVEAFSAGTCSAGEPSVPLNGSPTPLAYLSPDRMMAFSRLSRFGMTFAPLTDDRGQALLMWFREASRARTSALQEKAPAFTESAPECGATWRGSLARFDPDSRSWRTAQPSLLGDSEECSVTWPRSGMTADGRCWGLPMSGRRTNATDSGLWLGTPTASMTVRSSAFQRPGMTPAEFVRLWPTPTAHNAKEGAHPSEYERNCPTLAAQAGGALNPTWVEWLMGWPLRWTDLKPLAMDKSRSVPQKHGESLQEVEA